MAPIKGNRKRSNGASIEVANVIGAGTSKIKKKMRDIQRLLMKKRDVLPADVLLENERALETLKVELQNAEQQHTVKKLSKKYHMVRFFEKKKALRKYKQAKKQADELISTEAEKKEIKKAKKALKVSEIELAYIVNFPRDRKYIALFPNESGNKTDDDEKTKVGLLQTDEMRSAFKKEIEQMIKDNTLPISLKDIIAGNTGEKMTMASSFATTKEEEPEQQEEEEEEDELFE